MQNTHGGDVYTFYEKYGKKPLDFSANINPLGMPKNLLQDIDKMHEALSIYPDFKYRKLRQKVAKKEKVKPENILCGNGAADLIFSICTALSPKNALIPAPTFLEYEKALTVTNTNICYINLAESNDFALSLFDIENAYNGQDLLFICSPNNPTGRAETKEELFKILTFAKQKNMLVILDNCFLNFVQNEHNYSVSEYLNNFDNLIILKAFTKIYAMAGIRLGYLISSNLDLIAKIASAMQAWSVSAIAQICGQRALEHDDYIIQTKDFVQNEREFLQENLSKLGLKYYNSQANYILFKCQDINLQLKLEQHGILIRSCANYIGLTNEFYRIAVKTREENEKLIKSLEEVLNG